MSFKKHPIWTSPKVLQKKRGTVRGTKKTLCRNSYYLVIFMSKLKEKLPSKMSSEVSSVVEKDQ